MKIESIESIDLNRLVPTNATNASEVSEEEAMESLQKKTLVTTGRFLLPKGKYTIEQIKFQGWDQNVKTKNGEETRKVVLTAIYCKDASNAIHLTTLGQLMATDKNNTHYGPVAGYTDASALCAALKAKGSFTVISVDEVKLPDFSTYDGKDRSTIGEKAGKIMKWSF